MYDDNKIILPIWHNINAQEVSKYSHYLADKMALQTSLYSVKEIARELAEIAYRGEDKAINHKCLISSMHKINCISTSK